MKRLGRWTYESEPEVSYAQDCGFNFGRVLVLNHQKLTDLKRADIEKFRKRYMVAPRHVRVFILCAKKSRPFWQKFYSDSFLLTGGHPGPQAQA